MTRINQAISYFNVDCNVSIKVWENDFANKYEDLAKLCSAKRDYKMQKACMDQALECRRRASEQHVIDAILEHRALLTVHHNLAGEVWI